MICEARTHVGHVRPVNEDYIKADNERGIYLLADGMGGHEAGEVASKLAVEIAYAYIRNGLSDVENKDIVQVIGEAFQASHQAVKACARENQNLKGMGTTLLATVIVDNKAYIGSVGDSRLYLIRDSIQRITVDDTLGSNMLNDGKMTHKKIPNHYWNILTQAVGVGNGINPSLNVVRVFYDDVLIMCSDGLYNTISDDDIDSIAEKYHEELSTIVDRLLDKSLANGGVDNISMILLKRERESSKFSEPDFED